MQEIQASYISRLIRVNWVQTSIIGSSKIWWVAPELRVRWTFRDVNECRCWWWCVGSCDYIEINNNNNNKNVIKKSKSKLMTLEIAVVGNGYKLMQVTFAAIFKHQEYLMHIEVNNLMQNVLKYQWIKNSGNKTAKAVNIKVKLPCTWSLFSLNMRIIAFSFHALSTRNARLTTQFIQHIPK